MKHTDSNMLQSQSSLNGRLRLPAAQRGVSLFIVLVIVLLATLLTVWAARSALFSQMVIGNDADYQRAFEAAQLALQDAELDIQRLRSDGSDAPLQRGTATTTQFPDEVMDFMPLVNSLAAHAGGGGCQGGVCMKNTAAQDFWNDPARYPAMLTQAARYGQYTGAVTGTDSNPLLANNAWYWIEVMRYMDVNQSLLSGGNSNVNMFVYSPSADKPFVYRITAIARGLRPGTQVVLQTVVVPKRRD